jgi:pimeloyl-ACP methyl ester carboxylesterase
VPDDFSIDKAKKGYLNWDSEMAHTNSSQPGITGYRTEARKTQKEVWYSLTRRPQNLAGRAAKPFGGGTHEVPRGELHVRRAAKVSSLKAEVIVMKNGFVKSGGMSLVWLICLAPTWAQGLGMTLPTAAPFDENCRLNTPAGRALPPGLIGDYNWIPSKYEDSISAFGGSCLSSSPDCPPGGYVQENTGRLIPILKANAALRDSKWILLNALWTYLNVSPTLSSCPQYLVCGGPGNAKDAQDLGIHIAQLAVTGRIAFDTFVSWNSQYPAPFSGPQTEDLILLGQQGYMSTPALPMSVTNAELSMAASTLIYQAYVALWAIRSNDLQWRNYRQLAGWIAVSGEDDTPHRPVNVPTAPFPQFDLAVPRQQVKATGRLRSATLTTRYMIASSATSLRPTPGYDNPIPPLIPLRHCVIRRHKSPLCGRLELPIDDVTQLTADLLTRDFDLSKKSVIIYIHGGGSRLEEADEFAAQLLSLSQGATNSNFVVISFDLPDSAYGQPLDPAGFEDHPPGNILNYPILNFTTNYINEFILTLINKGVISLSNVAAVVGGSLGGNTSLLLAMNNSMPINSSWPPFAPAISLTDPPVYLQNIVSWSPTSMVSYVALAQSYLGISALGILSNTMTQSDWAWTPDEIVDGVLQSSGGPVYDDTRATYFYTLYFIPTAVFQVFGATVNVNGLPPDPDQWYRTDWNDQYGNPTCAAAYIVQSRYDRYEVYSKFMRRWTRAIDTEQVIFSFQTNSDPSNASYAPNYQKIGGRVFLIAGESDNFSNLSGLLGNFQDIYGFTHDIAQDMRNAYGRTLFIKDTGHSIHDERPAFLASQVATFLENPDNNINLTVYTGSSGLCGQIGGTLLSGNPLADQAFVSIGYVVSPPPANGQNSQGQINFPLNQWFAPNGGVTNPCQTTATIYVFPTYANFWFQPNTIHNFTVALPFGVIPTEISFASVDFVSNMPQYFTVSFNQPTSSWDLVAIDACSFPTRSILSAGVAPNPQSAASAQPLYQFSSSQTYLNLTPYLFPQSSSCDLHATNPPPSPTVPNWLMYGNQTPPAGLTAPW